MQRQVDKCISIQFATGSPGWQDRPQPNSVGIYEVHSCVKMEKIKVVTWLGNCGNKMRSFM